MPRFRSGNALRPIHRIKHVIDLQGGLVAGTQVTSELIRAVDSPVLANTKEVETGSRVNGFYLVVEAYATSSGALSNIYMAIQKNPGAAFATVAPNTVGGNDDKKWVIHQEMKMLQKEPTADALGGNPRTIFNGVVVIPKPYRRFGPNDILTLVLLCPGVTADFCFQCHYKEFK